MHDTEKALRRRFDSCPVWPVSRREIQTLFASLDETRESLRVLYEAMADGDPAWVKSDPRAARARELFDDFERGTQQKERKHVRS